MNLEIARIVCLPVRRLDDGPEGRARGRTPRRVSAGDRRRLHRALERIALAFRGWTGA